MIKRQMYGRAGLTLLRHRILLALRHASSPPELRQSQVQDSPDPGKVRPVLAAMNCSMSSSDPSMMISMAAR